MLALSLRPAKFFVCRKENEPPRFATMSQPDQHKPARKPRHPSVTAERVMEMCERRMTSLDNPGICFACGVEPDARRYHCEFCGEHRVYGCEEAALMLL